VKIETFFYVVFLAVIQRVSISWENHFEF